MEECISFLNALEIIYRFNNLETLKEQLEYLNENKDILCLVLEEDSCFVSFIFDVIEEDVYNQIFNVEELNFNELKGIDYLGTNKGIKNLLGVIGITVYLL